MYNKSVLIYKIKEEIIKLITKAPNIQDAKNVYLLAKNSKPLDLNSEYAYMLVCDHFSQTSVIAILDEVIIGFISGYVLPKDPKTLFIWQVATHSDYRGKKIPYYMFKNLLLREELLHIDNIKTTISPSNIASKKMFLKLANMLDSKVTTQKYIQKEDFLEESHEEEILYTIEDIKTKRIIL